MTKNKTFIFTLLFLSAFSVFANSHKPLVRDGTFLLQQQTEGLNAQLKNIRNAQRAFGIHPLNISFQVYNFVSGAYEYKPAVLAGEGKHCKIYTEKSNPEPWGADTKVKILQIIETFDNLVYPTVISWFGEIVIPENFLLEDKKIFIFLTNIQDNFNEGYVAGYFDYRDIKCLTGNQKPVFFMDTEPGKPGEPTDKNNSFYRTLAHEFQHMVSYSRRLALKQNPQKRWLDEGLSMFSEFIYSGKVGEPGLCLPPSPHYERFVESPAVNIFSSSHNSWFKEDLLYRKYGASFLFVTYMVEKYGGSSEEERQEFTRSLIDYKGTGAAGLDEFLGKKGTSLQEVFYNWILACYLNDQNLNSGKWHFDSIEIFPDAVTAQLPISMNQHYFEGGGGSFIGAEGETVANSPDIDSIIGEGILQLNFKFDEQMTPALVLLKNDQTVEFRKIAVAENGKFSGQYDLDSIEKMILLPLVLRPDFEEDKKYSYSYKSNINDLLLYPVANPAFPDQLIIFLRSLNEPLLATPTLNISFNNLVDSPHFYKLDKEGSLFAANYQLPGDGKGKAICHTGQNACSFSFSSASITERSTVRLNQENFSLQVSEGKISINPKVMLSIPSNSSVPLSGQILEGPCDVIFPQSGCATLSIKLADKPENGLGVCRINEQGKITLWRKVLKSDKSCSALLQSSGRYLLIKDVCEPNLLKFTLTNHGNGQLLKLTFKDDISGINFDSLKVFYKDKKLPLTILKHDQESVVALYGGFLSENSQIKIKFADHAENQATELRQATIDNAGVSMLNCCVYPNPCRREAAFNMEFSGPVILKNSKITIFDLSGMEIDCLHAVQIKTNQIQARWKLTDKNGRRVANGIYFAKINLNTDKGHFRSETRLAVVR